MIEHWPVVKVLHFSLLADSRRVMLLITALIARPSLGLLGQDLKTCLETGPGLGRAHVLQPAIIWRPQGDR